MAVVIENEFEGYTISLKIIEAYEATVIRPDGSEMVCEELFAENESDCEVTRYLEKRIAAELLQKEAEEAESEWEARQQEAQEKTE